MSNYIVTDTELTSIADAIRTKGGTSASLSYPNGFISAIEDISSGLDITNLTYVGLSVSSLDDLTFKSCTNLKSVYLPECTTFSMRAFNDCINLEGVYVPKYKNTYEEGGVTYFTRSNYQIKYLTAGCSYIARSGYKSNPIIISGIFPSCTEIRSDAFYNCSQIETVSFQTCTTIKEKAFYSCKKLSNVYMPSCTSVGSSAFYSCSALRSISMPYCTTIDEYAFCDCSNLRTAEFMTCQTIGENTFSGCNKLNYISFPACSHIGACAFQECNFAYAYFPNCEIIENYAFWSCANLTALYITSSSVCQLVGSSAFSRTPIDPYNNDNYSKGFIGYIYVLPSLVSLYQSANNWSYFSNRILPIHIP